VEGISGIDSFQDVMIRSAATIKALATVACSCRLYRGFRPGLCLLLIMDEPIHMENSHP